MVGAGIFQICTQGKYALGAYLRLTVVYCRVYTGVEKTKAKNEHGANTHARAYLRLTMVYCRVYTIVEKTKAKYEHRANTHTYAYLRLMIVY